MSGPSTSVGFDDMLDALGDVQRRRLLMVMLEGDPQEEILTSITDTESNEKAIEQVPELQHRHLPKLEEYGLIEWDQGTHDVSKGENFGDVKVLLEFLDRHEDELPADSL